MFNASRNDHLVRLPSGKRFRVNVPTTASRPWSAIQAEHVWHVCREHGLAAQGVSFVFDPVSRQPMRLDFSDARALASALNAATSGKS